MGGILEGPKLLLQDFSGESEARLVGADDYRWGGPGGDDYVRGSGGLAKQAESSGWCLTLDAGSLILSAFWLVLPWLAFARFICPWCVT